MSLAPGTHLGPYEVLAKLGEGGMGEVYRARDTRLKRDVAIKVLPPLFQNDDERLARFQREAELLAALNHPNIAQIYGLERTDGAHAPLDDPRGAVSASRMALVMELADGPTLADRIATGPLPIDESLAIARQVLDALDVAHERGIVHRDLKPANIKLTGSWGPTPTRLLDGRLAQTRSAPEVAACVVKVLDFGLAKAADIGDAPSSGTSATITSPALTEMGMILGTAAYMSPEQARGRPVDRRVDIWAFGCVLYEMLTARRAFGGEDVTDTLANVLKSDVNVGDLPTSVPIRIRRVIEACLQKDLRQRLASAQDVRLALDGVFDTPATTAAIGSAPPVPLWRRAMPYAVGAIVAALLTAGAAWRLMPAAEAPVVSRFDYDLPEGLDFRNLGRPVLAISPNGRSIVYNATAGLRIRTIGELEARVIPGTEAPLANPFFSPDSQHVAFFSSRSIVRMPVSGGAPMMMVKDIDNPIGAEWLDDGTILLALRRGIVRVPVTGGTPEVIVPAAENERVAMPQLLPGGESILFTLTTSGTTGDSSDWSKAQIVVHSLETQKRTVLLENARDARYVSTGHLVYVVEDDLFAAPFNLSTLALAGSSAPLVQGVWWQDTPSANWSVSANGTLVYVPNLPKDALRPVWVSREGVVAAATGIPDGKTPRLSADGKQVLVELEDDIWIYELATGRRRRVTSDHASGRPAWHPDGTHVAYSRSGARSEVWVAPIDGSGAPRKLVDADTAVHVDSWSPGGKTLLYHQHLGTTPNEILAINPGDAAPAPQRLINGPFHVESAVFSPDGRYIAYISAETGRREIFIRAFPGPGPAVPVSVGGGREPVWAKNGDLFYRSWTGEKMMVAAVKTTPTLEVGAPKELFSGSYFVQPLTGSPRPQFDVTADGRQLFMLQVDRAARPQIVVVQHWFEELKRVVAGVR